MPYPNHPNKKALGQKGNIYDSFLMIKDAIKASSKLKGTAIYKSPSGKTPKLPITTHINTKATNQERNVVCIHENFLEITNMAIANNNDQSPQTAPLIGLEGKTRPRFL
jgi:hypothetical protein